MHILGLKRCLLLSSALYTQCPWMLICQIYLHQSSVAHNLKGYQWLSYIFTPVMWFLGSVVILCFLVLGLWKNLEQPLGSFPKLAALSVLFYIPAFSCSQGYL